MTQATIIRWGNSQGIRLPKAVLQAAGMRTHDQVDINVQGKTITLTLAEKKMTLDDLFEGYEGGYIFGEFDTGEDVGAEVFE